MKFLESLIGLIIGIILLFAFGYIAHISEIHEREAILGKARL